MRAINHALTGAFIGLTVGEPLLAVPLALASHHFLDVIPHHGSSLPPNEWMRSKPFKPVLMIDAALCVVLVGVLFMSHPSNWFLSAICAFVATLPDFTSIKRFSRALKRKNWRPSKYSKFAIGIQWFERPIGAVVEVAWFVAGLILLVPFIR